MIARQNRDVDDIAELHGGIRIKKDEKCRFDYLSLFCNLIDFIESGERMNPKFTAQSRNDIERLPAYRAGRAKY